VNNNPEEDLKGNLENFIIGKNWNLVNEYSENNNTIFIIDKFKYPKSFILNIYSLYT
jgi:hypothetical protein